MSILTLASFLVFLFPNIVIAAKSSPGIFQGTKKSSRALFVFGDSLADNGNNNFLATAARADSPPYGIDYPSHRPTGRFSNGKTIPDFVEYIGIDPLLPYLDPKLVGKKLLNGVNFASAGVGILNDTGIQFVNIIRMPYQLALFESYKRRITGLIGAKKTKKLVNEALVLITCGGNDFVNNYYLVPNSSRSLQYELPDYVRLLVTEYRKILIRLYQLGARKILVATTGPLGCAPSIIAQRSEKGECAKELQLAANLFNPQLTFMMDLLNKKLGSVVFISVEAHNMFKSMITQSKSLGFEVTNTACCGQGPYNGVGLCTSYSNLCPNRDKYMFWDGYHPSERANYLFVQEIISGSEYINPMNLSTLMAFDSIKI